MASNSPALIGSLLMIGAAVALLRSGWRVGTTKARYQIALGWAVLLLSLFVLGIAIGTMIALAIATLAFGLNGYSAVVLNSERRLARVTRARQISRDAEPQSRGNGWGRGAAGFLLAMLAAIAVGSAIAGLPIGLAVNRVTIGAIVLPVVWAGFIIWVLSEPRLRRPALGLCGVIGASAILIAAEVLA